MALFAVVPVSDLDREWIRTTVQEGWGAEWIVSRGKVQYPHTLPGFIAVGEDATRLGLLTYAVTGEECEVVVLESFLERHGIGTALLEAVERAAHEAKCRRLWLITTNDNLQALGFYQRRGFTIAAVYCNALEATRLLKPNLPQIGANNIPLRDEIELERNLADHPSPPGGLS